MREYRLLIVDDDEVDRRLYCKMLTQPGFDGCNIRQAVDGATGLAALRASNFDCVLLDFNLPGMNGFEFINAATVDGELPCAVVLVTGQGNEAVAVEAMKRGVQDYLVKDQVDASNLWRAMTQAVSQAELRSRLAGSLRELQAANLALEQEAIVREAAETELRASRDAAEQANQAKTRFLSMMTHELRTPLNSILGYAQLLRLETGLSVRQDSHVAAMMQAGQHLLEMIDGVLDFAKIETGRLQLNPEQVLVRDLTEACIAFISPMATERALSLRVVNAHDAPRQIMADPARLRQVVLNLLSNAVKYTDVGNVELRVLAGSVPGALRIEVADTGRGINEANRELLFKDFERLDTTSSAEGTGLGLAIAARIVRLMGGTINYIPNPTVAGLTTGDANPGSLFWFELPAAEPVAQTLVDAKNGALPSSQRVLLVDDIKINRDIIGSFLHAAGHAVNLAESGAASLKLAAEQRFDLILMDVRMPDMDGLEAARRIRMFPGAHGQVPILALTAYTSLEQIACCMEAGMNGHVPKPVDYETLIAAINTAIAGVGPAAALASC